MNSWGIVRVFRLS